MEIDRLYLVLGYLNEFDGRTVYYDDEDIIEPVEAGEPASWFRRQLDALALERRVAPATVELDPHGYPELRSQALTALINGCYTKVHTSPRIEGLDELPAGDRPAGPYRQIHRQMYTSLNMFPDGATARIYSYLAGAYARDGEGDMFHIGGAQHKVDIIAALLRRLGCSDTTVTYLPGYVPRVYWLRYKSTPEVATWLARARDL